MEFDYYEAFLSNKISNKILNKEYQTKYYYGSVKKSKFSFS